MKNKLLLIIIVTFGILIIATILIISLTKNDKYKNYEIIEISYSYGGGYGTVIERI